MAPAQKPTAKIKTIGIIGGSTDLATAEYYRIINAEINLRLGGHHTGEIVIHSMDFAQSAYFVENNLWDEGGAYLAKKAIGLERAGSDVIICVSNTWHRSKDIFMKDVSIPLLHIVDPTATAVKSAGLTKVALLGTKATMSLPFLRGEYENRYGIEIVTPTDAEQDYMQDVIFGELSKSVFTQDARRRFLEIVDRLKAKGAGGAVLGCTEIPLLIKQEDRPDFPMFNTLELHARAAVDFALAA